MYADPTYRPGRVRFICKCDCGVTKSILSALLTRGKAVSCGCYRLESHTIHGASKSPEFKLWCGIKDRCINSKSPRYPYYGGRGIRIHPTWENDFGTFLAAVGLRPSPTHSLDRINNNGDYAPGNVRWATSKEQVNNRRVVNTMQTEVNALTTRVTQLEARIIALGGTL